LAGELSVADEQLIVGAHGEDDRRVLSPAWRGQRALRGLVALAKGAAPRLEIDARAVEHPDAFTGAALREATERHLAADRGHSVTIYEPRAPDALAMLADLIGPLARPARWAGEVPGPERERRVLLPATRIEDGETAKLLAYWLTIVAGPLRLPSSEARMLAAAALTFADNDLQHRAIDARPALLCACHEPQAHDLQIVCLSSHVPPEAAADPATYMRDLYHRSRKHLGGLYSLTALAERRGIDATLRVAVGTGRLFRRAEKARFDSGAGELPGFAASLEVHLRA
jgi:hypothetical protein